jgi:type I phosphodiesterase/nucleotide pyrophosphatase
MNLGKQASQASRDFLLSLSLANLCMVDPWTRVLGLSQGDLFFRRDPPSRMDLVGVVTAVLFLTATFWSVGTLAREMGPRWLKGSVRTTFLITLLIPVHTLVIRIPKFWWLETRATLWYAKAARHAPSLAPFAIGVVIVVFVAILIRYGQRIERYAVTAVMLEVPFVLITFFQAGKLFKNYDQFVTEFRDQPTVAMSPTHKARGRVVWLLFDELDNGMVDGSNRFGVTVPEIDRLRRESIIATKAVSPAFCTRLSIPSYLSGHEVSSFEPTGPSSAIAKVAQTKGLARQWNPRSNLFAQAKSEGYTTAMVGWYIPYCRILKESLNYCWWEPAYSNSLKTGATIPDDILTQLWNAADAAPLGTQALKEVDKVARCEHRVAVYGDIIDRAKKLSGDPRYDLVFIHFPIPHPPGFYRADRHQFDCSGDYVDNISLVDRTIGDMRTAMQAAGTWNDSTVIISSDHPYRTWLWGSIDERERVPEGAQEGGLFANVPLLVKLPGQHHGVRYNREFNTEVLHDMILSLIHGNISDPVELTGWLNENTATFLPPVPFSACPPFAGGGSGGSSGSRAGMDPNAVKTLSDIVEQQH